LKFFVQVVALVIVRPGKEGVDADKVGKVRVEFGRVLYVMNLYSKCYKGLTSKNFWQGICGVWRRGDLQESGNGFFLLCFFVEFGDVEICKKVASEYRSSKAPYIVILRSKCTRALTCKEFLHGLNNVIFDEFI
jgi:hypothetical protein